MKTSRFTESQIVAILKEAENGLTIKDNSRNGSPEEGKIVSTFKLYTLGGDKTLLC